MKILYLFPNSRRQILRDFNAKKCPDTLLYGFNHLKKQGHEVSILDLPEKPFFLYLSFVWLEEIIYGMYKAHFQIYRIIGHLKNLNDFDVIFAFGEAFALPILLLKRMFLVKPKVVYFSFSFVHRFKKGGGPLFFFFKFLILSSDYIVCFSKLEEFYFRKIFNVRKEKIISIPAGVDVEYYSKGKRNPSLSIVIGRGSRDFETFFKAAKNIRQNFTLVTTKSLVEISHVPDNVNIIFDLPQTKLRELYRKAKISIIPLKDEGKGQLVLLDSLSTGVPTIITKTKGILNSYPLKDNINVIFTKPGDWQDLRKKTLYLLSSEELQRELSKNGPLLAKKYSTFVFAQKLSYILDGFKFERTGRS